jgi:hypothetical protein
MGRPGLAALLALLGVLGLAACGGGNGGSSSGGGGGRLVVETAAKRAFRPDVDSPRSYNSPTTAEIRLSEDPQGARPWFVELYQHGEPIDRALTNGLCAGMKQLKDLPAAAGNWRDFLLGWVERFAPKVSQTQAESRVDELTNIWDLSKLSPADAGVYWKSCVNRP